MIALKEGAHGIVAIVDRGASRRLKLNNHYVLGGTLAAGDERFQAHLPLLLHPEPQSVAFLGYGSGITAGASLFHSVTNVLALEIVPEVLDLSNTYFAEANGALSFKIRYVEEDARNYLRGTSMNYDVIVGDLVVPWRQGEGALYTIENFRAVQQRLAGLYCCWLPMFQLSRDDFEIILRTFLQVFPAAEIWRGDFSPEEPAIALVTRSEGLASAGSFGHRMAPDPTNPHLRFESALWMHFVGVVTNVPPGDLNRDDRPIIEFRRSPIVPFVGRQLQQWERQVSAASLGFKSKLSPVQQTGWQAGELMRSFTQLLSEGKERDAASVAQQIRSLLGEEVARSVFGPAPRAEE